MEKQKQKNNVIKIMNDLVHIPSYGDIGKQHPIIKYLKDNFIDCYEILDIEDSNKNIHLLIGVNCELKNIENCILLSGHIDTVRESCGHDCNAVFEENKLSGLGVSDMKSFIATIIANKNFIKSLNIPVVISITSDEETKLLGIEKIISEMKKRNINPNLTIVGEPTNLDYYMSSRGNCVYVSIMNGVACHSGTPELGINAIELVGDFINEIKKITKQYEKEASICITSINGGKVPSNIVPDECSICFSIRTSDKNVLEKINEYLLEKHDEISKGFGDSKIFKVVSIPPFKRNQNKFFEEQADIFGKLMKDAKYATEAGYIQDAFPNANIMIYGPGNSECIHKAGEFIYINSLLQYEEELNQVLNNFIDYNKNEEKNNKKKTYDIKNK